jgi:pilus assembly protein Flp/PilA
MWPDLSIVLPLSPLSTKRAGGLTPAVILKIYGMGLKKSSIVPMITVRSIIRKGGFTIMLFLPREEGQGLVEYALILVLVAIVVIAILLLLGPIVGNVFSNIVRNM